MKSRAEARRALGIRMLKCVGSRLLVFAVAVVALLQLASGCDHPGKTASEVHRQHRRAISINQQEMMQDVDAALLLDRPSRLTELRMQ